MLKKDEKNVISGLAFIALWSISISIQQKWIVEHMQGHMKVHARLLIELSLNSRITSYI
jgi:hypothetical protein